MLGRCRLISICHVWAYLNSHHSSTMNSICGDVFVCDELGDSLPRFSDKVILPQSLLATIVQRYPDTMPHPLIFQLKYGEKEAYVGVKEFYENDSTEDDRCGIPWVIRQHLAIQLQDSGACMQCTLVEAMPRGLLLTLKPIQQYKGVTNWKYLLESRLRYYTVLTKGTILCVEGSVPGEVYELFVEEVEPASTVCIIDTDMDLNVKENSGCEDIGVVPEVELSMHLGVGERKVHKIQKSKVVGMQVCLESEDGDNENVEMVAGDKLVSPDCYQWSTQSAGGIYVEPNSFDNDAEDVDPWLYVIPFVWAHASTVRVVIKAPQQVLPPLEEGMTTCPNCGKHIPRASLILHENFCLRNNVKCGCGKVFLKQIPESHWTCTDCGAHGDGIIAREKHDQTYHSGPYRCAQCEDPKDYGSSVDLVLHHKVTTCPAKLHECRFCHLIVPQELATYEDTYNKLTHHENYCGNKTSDCYQCGKIVKLKDMRKHLKVHDLAKEHYNEVVAVTTLTCSNVNCTNIVAPQSPTNNLGLCDVCFGPLYLSVYDPDGTKIQGRIERRYVIQLTRGCGKPWCKNRECKSSGLFAPKSMQETLQHVKVLLARLFGSLPTYQFYFCVDQNTTKRKLMVDELCGQGDYKPELVYKAVNEVRDVSETRVRDWLNHNAVKAH